MSIRLKSRIPVRKFRKILSNLPRRVMGRVFYGDFSADGLAVSGRNLAFMENPAFAAAWDHSYEANKPGWRGAPPDIRWRAHVACWAAEHGLSLEGDFVECGVHTGLLSLTVLHYLQERKKRFWLFDTFNGIPVETVADDEKAGAASLNDSLYFDCLDIAKRNFSPFENAVIVPGAVPQSLHTAPVERVCYLSLDMNNAAAEIAALEFFWPRLVPGAIVLLDDYGFRGHERQQVEIDAFASSRNVPVLSLPTGQGIIVRSSL